MFINGDTVVGLLIFFTLINSDGFYLGVNEITELVTWSSDNVVIVLEFEDGYNCTLHL